MFHSGSGVCGFVVFYGVRLIDSLFLIVCVALFYYTDGSKGVKPQSVTFTVSHCRWLRLFARVVCGFVLLYRRIKSG